MRPGIQAALALFAFAAFTPAQANAQGARGELVKNSYIVTFTADAGPPERVAREMVRGQGNGLRHVYSHALRGMAIEIPAHAAPQVLAALRRNPRVASIGNDMTGSGVAQILPKGVDRINAEAGQRPNDGSGVRVAILDTGLDFAHADFAGAIDRALSVDCVNFSGCATGGADDNGHGTFVGGIIAARDNDLDVVGVAPASSLVAVKVLAADNTGLASDFIAGIDHLAGLNAAGTRIDIANASIVFTCSFCTATSTNSTVTAMRKAISALVAGGTTFVAAAGNDAADVATTLPAAFAETIAVSALSDSDGQPGGESMAGFSNFGAAIDITAPGASERSLLLGGGTRTGSGTSFSAPHVAGVAALFVRDRVLRSGQRPDPATVRRALVETGECRGGLQHAGLGCGQTWSGDRDSFAEPLVRADLVAGFSSFVADAALESLALAAPVLAGEPRTVSVGISNAGTVDETLDLTLSENGVQVASVGGIPLTAGQSRVIDLTWQPASAGTRTLVAALAPVPDETVLANNSLSLEVEVFDRAVEDIAVAGLSAPADLTIGDRVQVDVDLVNQGSDDETVEVALESRSLAGGARGSTGPTQSILLAAGSAARLAFTLDSSGADAGDHELIARATLVNGVDADTADNSLSRTIRFNASAVPATATPLYVGGIALDLVRRGRKSDLLGSARLLLDSDGSGTASGGDTLAKGAMVTFRTIRDANGDGSFDCLRDVCQSFTGSTNGKGEASFALASPVAGRYRVEIIAAELAGSLYDRALDSGNPALIVID